MTLPNTSSEKRWGAIFVTNGFVISYFQAFTTTQPGFYYCTDLVIRVMISDNTIF